MKQKLALIIASLLPMFSFVPVAARADNSVTINKTANADTVGLQFNSITVAKRLDLGPVVTYSNGNKLQAGIGASVQVRPHIAVGVESLYLNDTKKFSKPALTVGIRL